MKKLIAYIAVAAVTGSCLAQISPENDRAARSLGFRNYSEYLKTTVYCLDLLKAKTKVSQYSEFQSCSKGDMACFRRVMKERTESLDALLTSPDWVSSKCSFAVPKILLNEASPTNRPQYADPFTGNSDPGILMRPFEVVAAVSGCKYFVAEQLTYALVESWACLKPRKGDRGSGELSTFGMTSITVNGMSCDVRVEGRNLSKSDAFEKFIEKCD